MHKVHGQTDRRRSNIPSSWAPVGAKNALYVELGGSVISNRLFKSHISIGGEFGTFASIKKILGGHVNIFRKDKNNYIIHNKL